MSEKKQGYWNGKPVEYEILLVKVTNRLEGAMSWCKPFIGEDRQAVKVMVPHHRPFYIDNDDGSGYLKVIGGGDPKTAHRSLGEPKELKEVPRKHWQTKLNKSIGKATTEASDAYWKKKDPEGFKRVQHLRRAANNAARHGSASHSKPKQ